MKKDPKVFLSHMLECIMLIEQYARGKSEYDFLETSSLQDSIVHRIEVLGEAARNIPKEFREAHPEIPWKKITGTRDKLVHEYFGIDLILTWQVVKHNLPELKKQLKAILE